jgi:hypothetical protein
MTKPNSWIFIQSDPDASHGVLLRLRVFSAPSSYIPGDPSTIGYDIPLTALEAKEFDNNLCKLLYDKLYHQGIAILYGEEKLNGC